MMPNLVRWVLLAAILATGMAGYALIATTVCSTAFRLQRRGFTLVMLACVAAAVYAVAYAAVPGFSS